MESLGHYRVLKRVFTVLWIPGVLGWVLALLGVIADGYGGLAFVYLLVVFVASHAIPRIFPAHCSKCGDYAYLVREAFSDEVQFLKYRRRACGHVHDLGAREIVGGD